MTDLQIATGFLTASRNANRARQIAEKQLEEARTATEYAREAATAAKQGARAEQERLVLERERFEAEQRERFLRMQATAQQQQARELLADALLECDELMAAATPSDTADRRLRRLAGMQARVIILEECREALSDLADKTAFRQLRNRVTTCIRQFADVGGRGDPWAVVQDEISRMRGFVVRGRSLAENTRRLAAETQVRKNAPLPYGEWQARWQRLQDFRVQWPIRLAELANDARVNWWDADGDFLDQEWQGLLLLESLVSQAALTKESGATQANSLPPEETISELRSWRLFSQRKGDLYGELQRLLGHAQQELDTLNEVYLADQSRWQQAFRLTTEGNYQQAEELLKTCRNQVVNEEYHRCTQLIVDQQSKLHALTKAPLMEDLQAEMSCPWPLLPHAFRAALQKRRGLIRTMREWLESQGSATTLSLDTDFSRAWRSVLAVHARVVEQIEARAKDALRYRRILERIVVAAVVAAVGLTVLSSVQEIQDKRQRANIQKQAGEIAARRAHRRTEVEHLTETIRLAAEAEKQRQAQAAIEARAQEDQRLAAEAKRTAAEAEEQRQREAAKQHQLVEEAGKQRQRNEELERIAQAKYQEQSKLDARNQQRLIKERDKQDREAHRQELLNGQKSGQAIRPGGWVECYGLTSLTIPIRHGYITMPAGANYLIASENVDGTVTAIPVGWDWKDVHSEYYDSNHWWQLGNDLSSGVRIKPEYLTPNKPNPQ